jgi:hypothetical protein
MGKLIAYCRLGCGPSFNTKSKLIELKKISENINNFEIIINDVKDDVNEKNNIRSLLKPVIHNYNTFPIIIYETTSNNKFLIGGNSDLMEILSYIETINKLNMQKIALINNEGRRKLIYYLLLINNKININEFNNYKQLKI